MTETSSEQSRTGEFPAITSRDDRRLPALLIASDPGQERPRPAGRVVVFERALVIGRRLATTSADETPWVVRDPHVSSRHAEIRAAPGGYELRDLGSTNGTYVGGAPVTGPVRLVEGAVLFFGHQVAVFRTLGGRDIAALRRELAEPFGPVPLVSPAFVGATDRLRRLAAGTGELLIVGETGVGKEVYARAAHAASGRAGRFVAVNCAAVPRELVESELFGFARGAHSQARENKAGLIEGADGGTLFLDEIGEMSPELQSKLLRFVQDRFLLPIGGTQPRRIDVRVIAATNRLEPPPAHGGPGLRLDLQIRLGAEPLRLPPLREHVEDLGALAAHFLRGRPQRIAPEAFRALCLYDWPGNVRELEKTLQEAAILSRDAGAIELEHLPPRIAARAAPAILRRWPLATSSR